MNKLKFILFGCFICFGSKISAQTILVDYTSNWSYYDNADEPADNGGFDWNDINYDASSWSQGNAELGYGNSDENTVVNSSAKTVYFRYNFEIPDSMTYDGVKLDLIFDDCAIVYLNGSEVWRANMPNGAVNYNTLARGPSLYNEMASYSFESNLLSGDNVLAVEIHQESNSSVDLSFDIRLTASNWTLR